MSVLKLCHKRSISSLRAAGDVNATIKNKSTAALHKQKYLFFNVGTKMAECPYLATALSVHEEVRF
jgi:hypothetical protein